MGNRRRQAAVALVGGACALLVAACSSSAPSAGAGTGGAAASTKSILICNVTDLTGLQQPLASTEDAGGLAAVSIINAAGGIKSLGGAKLTVQKFDTQSSPDQGVTEATKAVAAGCKAIFGGEITDTVLAATPVSHRAGVPWVDVGGSGDEVHDRGFNDVFQLQTTTAFATSYYDMMVAAAKALGIAHPTVGLSVSDTTYGQDFYSIWSGLNAKGPFNVVSNVSYPLSTTDFSSVAARMVSAHPDFLFNMGYPSDGIALGRLLKQTFHTTAKEFFSTAQASATVPQLGALAEGQLFDSNSPPVSDAQVQKFSQVYQSIAKTAPTLQASQGYTAVMFIAAALEKAGSTNGAAITSALHSVTLTAADGNIYSNPMTFNSSGTLANSPWSWQQDQNGKLPFVYPPNLKQAGVIPYSG